MIRYSSTLHKTPAFGNFGGFGLSRDLSKVFVASNRQSTVPDMISCEIKKSLDGGANYSIVYSADHVADPNFPYGPSPEFVPGNGCITNDGQYIYMAETPDGFYPSGRVYSIDGGANWTSEPGYYAGDWHSGWRFPDCSVDGSVVAYAAYSYLPSDVMDWVDVSSDYMSTHTRKDIYYDGYGVNQIRTIAVSASGQYILPDGYPALSSDYGATFTIITTSLRTDSVSMSDDGQVMGALIRDQVYHNANLMRISTDYGVTWPRLFPDIPLSDYIEDFKVSRDGTHVYWALRPAGGYITVYSATLGQAFPGTFVKRTEAPVNSRFRILPGYNGEFAVGYIESNPDQPSPYYLLFVVEKFTPYTVPNIPQMFLIT